MTRIFLGMMKRFNFIKQWDGTVVSSGKYQPLISQGNTAAHTLIVLLLCFFFWVRDKFEMIWLMSGGDESERDRGK